MSIQEDYKKGIKYYQEEEFDKSYNILKNVYQNIGIDSHEINLNILYSLLANLASRNEENYENEKYLKDLLNIDEGNVNALINIGILYRNIGKFNKSIKNLKKALELKNDDVLIIIQLAESYLKKLSIEEAINLLRTAREIEPENKYINDRFSKIINKNHEIIDKLKIKKDELLSDDSNFNNDGTFSDKLTRTLADLGNAYLLYDGNYKDGSWC